jgi:hypothetical protein
VTGTLGRIVIVCLEFSSAYRMRALAEGLSALGHRVTYVTAEPGAHDERYEVVVIPYRSGSASLKSAVGMSPEGDVASAAAKRGKLASRAVGFAARAWEEYTQHPDKHRPWRDACRSWAQENVRELADTSWVIASSPPLTDLMVGIDLADAIGCRLLVDFRDLWTGNPYYPFGALRRMVDTRAEKRVLARADAVTTVTEPLAETLGGDTRAIYTGIDPSPWRTSPYERDPRALRLVHTGTTYSGRRDLRPLADAIARLGATGAIDPNRMRVSVIGDADDRLREHVARTDVADSFAFASRRPADLMPDVLAHTDVALLVLWEQDTGGLPLKTQHYLAAGREILVLGARPDSDTVRVTGALPGVTVVHDSTALETALVGYWNRWLAEEDFSAGETDSRGDDHVSMAKRFVAVMEQR